MQAMARERLFAEAAAREKSHREALTAQAVQLRSVIERLSTAAARLAQRDDLTRLELAQAEALHTKTNEAIMTAMVRNGFICLGTLVL